MTGDPFQAQAQRQAARERTLAAVAAFCLFGAIAAYLIVLIGRA